MSAATKPKQSKKLQRFLKALGKDTFGPAPEIAPEPKKQKKPKSANHGESFAKAIETRNSDTKESRSKEKEPKEPKEPTVNLSGLFVRYLLALMPNAMLKVYILYVKHSDWTTGEGYAKHKTMAREAGIERETFSRYSAALEDAGLLTVLMGGTFGRSNKYQIVRLTEANLPKVKQALARVKTS